MCVFNSLSFTRPPLSCDNQKRYFWVWLALQKRQMLSLVLAGVVVVGATIRVELIKSSIFLLYSVNVGPAESLIQSRCLSLAPSQFNSDRKNKFRSSISWNDDAPADDHQHLHYQPQQQPGDGEEEEECSRIKSSKSTFIRR